MTAPTATRTHAALATELRIVISRLSRQLRHETVGTLTLSQWSALAAVETAGPVRIEAADARARDALRRWSLD